MTWQLKMQTNHYTDKQNLLQLLKKNRDLFSNRANKKTFLEMYVLFSWTMQV